MITVKTTQEVAWNLNLRVRVGDSVTHNGSTWTNTTGKNSEPGVGTDWKAITSGSGTLTLDISGNIFGLVKHPGNSDTQNVEVNDMIVNGWWSTTEFWGRAIYLGGNLSDRNNWNVLDFIEEIILV